MNNKKRGISPLIATVLLIAFIVALVAIVMVWGKGYIEEKAEKEGALSEAQLKCTNVKVKVDVKGNSVFLVNSAIQPINGLIVRSGSIVIKCKKGSKKCTNFKEMKQLDSFDLIANINDVNLKGKDIDVIPAIIPDGIGAPLVPCSEQMKTIMLSKK